MTWFKKKDFVPQPGRAPYPKKGEGNQSFRQLQKGREVLFLEGVQGELDGPILKIFRGLESARS